MMYGGRLLHIELTRAKSTGMSGKYVDEEFGITVTIQLSSFNRAATLSTLVNNHERKASTTSKQSQRRLTRSLASTP